MERIFEFVGNHTILSGIFAVVLLAWIIYEVSRMTRKWNEVDSLGAVRMINREDPIILDVSNSGEYAKGHIHGALHMPQSKIEAGNQELLKHKERPVLVYCKNGQVAPQMATRLTRMGFTNVNVLSGGMTQWLADHQPVTRHKGAVKAGGGKDKKKARAGKGKASEDN